MSPHVGNFVQDLVEMAKATERLPGLEAELAKAHDDIETYAKQVQAREMHIIELKAEIDAKNEVIRSLEVAKDQAETMFLELDEKTNQVVHKLCDAADVVKAAMLILDPPKPQPEPVKAEPEATIEPAGNVDQGQGEPDPTASGSTASATDGPSEQTAQVYGATSTNDATATQPSPGSYSGLRYYDHPTYVAYDSWIEGGGTEEDYNWRPNYSQQA